MGDVRDPDVSVCDRTIEIRVQKSDVAKVKIFRYNIPPAKSLLLSRPPTSLGYRTISGLAVISTAIMFKRFQRIAFSLWFSRSCDQDSPPPFPFLM
jgi:hypothetical protein